VRIAVVGAGAVGCLFGARLAASGHRVHLVARAAVASVLNERGITVEGVGSGRWGVTASVELPPKLGPEMVLLTVKTFDLANAAATLARQWPTPVPTLLPQNGLGVEGVVASATRDGGWADPPRWLVRAVNTIPSTLIAPGVVRQPGDGELLIATGESAGPSADATRAFGTVLSEAGLPVRSVGDLGRELWRKALVNAAINPVTAIHRVPNGSLLEEPFRAEATALLREAQRAAASAGFEFDDPEADRSLERVVRATAGNRSSMLQDVDRGHPTEIDAISGELVRVAAGHGIDLPATRAVLARLGRPRPKGAGGAQPS
jgi:2-dehydropantoate 2-reductase